MQRVRKQAHTAVNPLWQSGQVTRKEGDVLLAEPLQLRLEEVHILSGLPVETLHP